MMGTLVLGQGATSQDWMNFKVTDHQHFEFIRAVGSLGQGQRGLWYLQSGSLCSMVITKYNKYNTTIPLLKKTTTPTSRFQPPKRKALASTCIYILLGYWQCSKQEYWKCKVDLSISPQVFGWLSIFIRHGKTIVETPLAPNPAQQQVIRTEEFLANWDLSFFHLFQATNHSTVALLSNFISQFDIQSNPLRPCGSFIHSFFFFSHYFVLSKYEVPFYCR